MKKVLALAITILIGFSHLATAQRKPATTPPKLADSLPYQKYPTLPAFQLLEMDSSTLFNTYYIPEGRPSVLMFFSPDCDHCQHLTQEIIKHMDSLGVADFYLMTPMSLTASKAFYTQYHLQDYKNIHLYKDYQFFFPRFYGATYVPYLAVYDKHKKFVRLFVGGAKINELIQAVYSEK